MKFTNVKYAAGMQAALQAFNVPKLAGLFTQSRLNAAPRPANDGAAWFAQALQEPMADASSDAKPLAERLERPSSWGPRVSLESGNTPTPLGNSGGFSAYGGV